MKRFINFRALLFIFIGAIVAAVFTAQFFMKNKVLFFLSVGLILGLTLFVLFAYLFDKKKRLLYLNKFILSFLIGFIVVMCLSSVNFYTFSKNVVNIKNAYVNARICSVSEKSEYTYLIVEDCKIYDIDKDKSQKLNGKISLTISNSQGLNKYNIGDKIKFSSDLEGNNLIEQNNFNSYFYKHNIKYSVFVEEESVYVEKGSLKLDEKIRLGVKNILFNNLSYDNASIAYACIFGDKTLIDENIYNSFNVSGTLHILCVSGLHIGFLVALIYFILKLFKIKKKYIFFIFLIFLPFYCYLCGFSPSVVRASIMSLVLCFATAFGNKYDSLTALSFAGLLILLVRPFYVFDLGFKLSFASCFGIILLSPTFNKIFEKIKFSNKFSDLLSITLSAQIATFPIILFTFGKMSFLSTLANIVVVPIFGAMFSLLMIFTLLNTFLPFGFLFKVIELVLSFITIVTRSFGSISSMILNVSAYSILFNLLFYIIVLLLSKFINMKNKLRILYICIFATIFCFSYLFQFYPINYAGDYILNMSLTNSTIITNSENIKVMVGINNGTNEDLLMLRKDLNDFKILTLDAIILPYYSEEMQTTVISICNEYNVHVLFVPDDLSQNAELQLFENLDNTRIYKVNNISHYNGFTFEIISEINGVHITSVDHEHKFTMLVVGNLNKTTSQYLIDNNIDADIVKLNYLNNKYIESLENFDKIYCEKTQTKQSNVYLLKDLRKVIKY